MTRAIHDSIESSRSWRAAVLTVVILSVAFGAPLLAVVGMRQIQADMGTDRSVIAMASALIWVGNAIGGVVMGRLSVKIGMRLTAVMGTISVASGLALSSLGTVWAIYVGHGLLIGLLGLGALYAPLTVYVSYWFDRRRGTALALVASGQYVAGILWPAVIEQGMARYGWQAMMLVYGALVVAVMPIVLMLAAPPEHTTGHAAVTGPQPGARVLGLPPNVVQVILCIAGFFCCVPMALPASHLVAFCGDIGIPAAHGAAMLSVMLTCAFVARQMWGAIADRIGGLRTILTGSAAQMITLAAFLATNDETGLFVIAATFGAGFSGIIPAYSVAVRELFPARDASWRIPTTLLCLMSGMAFGSWFGGALFDLFLSYRVAFIAGVAFNLVNFLVISALVSRTVAKRQAPLAAMS
jgi:MFS family permease